MKASTKAQIGAAICISIGVNLYKLSGYLHYREILKSGEEKIWKAADTGEIIDGPSPRQ